MLRFAWGFAVVALLPACSASGGGVAGPPGTGGSSGAGGGQNDAGPGGSGGAPAFDGGGGGDAATCAVHCSADLHQVVDCHGTVVKSCGQNQGCGPGGTCIDACQSAEANHTTVGCDFYAALPAPESLVTGSCFAALLANTWDQPITLQAEYNGQSLAVGGMAREPVTNGGSTSYQPLANGQLDPGHIAILFLAQGPSGPTHYIPCPSGVTPGVKSDVSINGTGRGHAFRITASAPIIAYDIYPYGGAQSYVSSATLLVPTAAWGTNYIAADAYEQDTQYNVGAPFVQVVARDDATNVTISPVTSIAGGAGVPATGQGQPATYTLARGEMIQFLQGTELAGSAVQSDKPISLWGGSSCMNIPAGKFACDAAHQELVPVKSLGSEYVAVRYRDRVAGQSESVPWTIVGAVDGTTLSYDPAPPAGAPMTIKQGQMVRFNASDPFVVKSQDDQHPFYFDGHMTGWQALAQNPAHDGDPEYVTVIPPKQYLSKYLFLTDVTYKQTNLVFVRAKAKDGSFKDVNLDCAGTLGGWTPIGGSGDYEYTRVDLELNGKPVGNCQNGVHTADSAAPFGLTVWGWDYAVSYAYPAGMGTEAINTVVVPPIPQ